jgi:phosphoribosylanthranilate isomerase
MSRKVILQAAPKAILKVCGITNQPDATAAIAAGATAIGFNFYPKSPRYIAPESAARIATPGALRVGVFVNQPALRIAEIARIAALDVAQLHGDETPAQYPRNAGPQSAGTHSADPGGSPALAVWKAARVSPDFDFSSVDDCPADALLLDGPAAELFGGAGHTFDWTLAKNARHRIIVAGGLDASNVARAIALAQPWGVDSCSRIECSPGIKDHTKMIDFLHAAKAALRA